VTRRLPRRVYLAIGRLSRTRFVRRFHPVLYRRFHGAAFLGRTLGCRTVVLHATGARSGAPRPVALYAFPVPDAPGAASASAAVGSAVPLAVVASNGGAGHPPAWYRNIRAHPDVVVEDGPDHWVVRAREAAGDERERLWAVIAGAFPGYEDYQARTAGPIPVVVLEPASDGRG
jgi:deazaflavin-dependent oxidoreductase (nitroreductase family)